MVYLEEKDLFVENIIEYEDEKLLLIERQSYDEDTYIKDDEEFSEDENLDVFIKQRWKVSVLPKTRFDKYFTTHRNIECYYCKFNDLPSRLEGEDIVWKNNIIDTNELGDDFNGML